VNKRWTLKLVLYAEDDDKSWVEVERRALCVVEDHQLATRLLSVMAQSSERMAELAEICTPPGVITIPVPEEIV